MEQAPVELMKAYVNGQKFSSTTEVMEAMESDVPGRAATGDGRRNA